MGATDDKIALDLGGFVKLTGTAPPFDVATIGAGHESEGAGGGGGGVATVAGDGVAAVGVVGLLQASSTSNNSSSASHRPALGTFINTANQFAKAAIPVCARPRINACTSCVPS